MPGSLDSITFQPHAGRAPEPGPGQSVTPGDLHELLGAFNEVTGKLQASHERLTSEVHRLQRELTDANQRLERSRRLAALGEMAAGIAHEIRNPLGSIGLYARMLEEDLAHAPEQASIAGKIAEGVRGIDAIVRDVLSFAREIKPRIGPVDAEELLTQACETALAGVRVAGIDLPGSVACEIEPEGLALACDAGLVRQALVNLIRNAAEAMASSVKGDPGSAPPRPSTLRLGAGVDGSTITLRVEDSGPGIPPEVIDRMFNPFFTTRDTGAGLGLAIVHRIADAHGGSVVVESKPGSGARFDLVLPGAAILTEHESLPTEHAA